ncbi:hypothetical protein GCM10007962_28530 [Yeosuana aromativorans]|uniref:Uncharacterized protein n=1 Tax=Yeosuana aromativorans TaxID=288019 RepID=A0A8J3BNT4_9FLAO|nr:hypothetical protein [Yeosuana aromativorans]GGK32482.1 hypothetical protein GCM10007962_28530 [Yeosuana aromativorans]
MRNRFFIACILSLFAVSSCNDGNIIDVTFDFDTTFKACDGVSNLVFYKTKKDPSESLSVLIKSLKLEDILSFKGKDTIITKTGSTFNYRTYSNTTLPSGLFCSDIPPSDLQITNDSESSAEAVITATLTEDDKDGVPYDLEYVLDSNGELLDTDGDGIPNYKDADDDGDNVLTKDENPDPNKDGNLDDAQDTDGDGTPDYLDTDDDGDGILTRDEENDSQDQNPGNDVTNIDVGADYLNPDVATQVPATAYRSQTIYKTYLVTMIVNNISLENIYQETMDFGTLEDSSLSESYTIIPPFN